MRRAEADGARWSLIIAWPGDSLAQAVIEELRRLDRPARLLSPPTLGSRAVTCDGAGATVDGHPVGGVLWRVQPDAGFSDEYEPEDRSFVDAEVRAIWLCIMNSPGVAAPYRPDPAGLFAGPGTLYWRRRLAARGVPLSPFAYGSAEGEVWVPYRHPTVRRLPDPEVARTLGAAVPRRRVGGRVFFIGEDRFGDGVEPRADATERAIRALRACGLHLGALVVDSDGVPATVDPFAAPPPSHVPAMAESLCGLLRG